MKRLPTHVEHHFFVEKRDHRPPLIKQVHGSTIVPWSRLQQQNSSQPPEADGLYTLDARLPIYIFTADCLPVLLFAEEPEAPIMAIHAGWRGAKAGIVKKGLEIMWQYSENVHAILGPSILDCCFEVKDDFVAEFTTARGPIDPYIETRSGKMYFKLAQFVVDTELADVPTERLHFKSVRCTYCSRPELPSYRRNGSTDVRICGWIAKVTPRDKVSK